MPTAADYDALEVIGQGSFGSIRKVRRKADGVIMARKEIRYDKMEAKERDQLTSEFSILSALRHPNIVEYHHREHVKEQQMVYIYMEYCGGGDLSGLLKDLRKKGTSLREDVIWSIFVQLVSALYRCHYGVDPPDSPPNTRNQAPPAHIRGNTVIHRDLKPENVFLDENNFVKLGDFGLSKMLGSEHQMAMTYVGTPLYMSPELVSDTPYTIKTDIWSLGCIMYELCTLKPPFTAKSPHQLFHTIKQGKFDPIPNYYSAELRAVIEQCLRCEAKERPETAQLLFMPAMQNFRKQREMVLLRKQLQAKESLLNIREAQLAAKEREIANVENRLVGKNNTLIAKERELVAKDQELRAKEQEMKHYLEERSHRIREQIDMELRNEWRMKAEIEVRQQVERMKMDLESHFEFEVNQRVEAQVNQRVEAELHRRVEAQLVPRVEMELERRITELNLVPAHTLSLNSAHSSSTSSQLSAETGITSVSSSSSFHSPARHSFPQLSAPESPADIDMHSPSHYQDQTPAKQRDGVFDKPPVLNLRQSLLQKSFLEHRLSDPNPLGNTSMNDLFDEPETDEENNSRSENTTPLQRVASTGSPFKRVGNGPIRRTQTTTAVNLFPSSTRSSLGPEDFSMAKVAAANSLNRKENQPRAKSLIELAKLRDEERKVAQQKAQDTVATWDAEKDEMPSPFIVKTRRIY